MIKDNISGKRFRKLTVIGPKPDEHGHLVKWECRCDCGKIIIIQRHSITRSKNPQNSCGCDLSKRYRKHGAYNSPEYHVWEAMLQRCQNNKHPQYKDYGGRGINVTNRWLTFVNFLADMGLRPGSEYSIERKDNNEGYSKDNCKWAVKAEQVRNTRRNIKITAFGETKCLKDWCLQLNLLPVTVKRTLAAGFDPEYALSKHPRVCKTGSSK